MGVDAPVFQSTVVLSFQSMRSIYLQVQIIFNVCLPRCGVIGQALLEKLPDCLCGCLHLTDDWTLWQVQYHLIHFS